MEQEDELKRCKSEGGCVDGGVVKDGRTANE